MTAKEVGEVQVRISADTSAFEAAVERNIMVVYIHAIRELAFAKMMLGAHREAFELPPLLAHLEEVVKQTPEELHAVANDLEKELAQATQGKLETS